jgi:flagellar biosynthesis/type III secretory pathway protein FliH
MTDSFLDNNPPFQAYLTKPMSVSDVDNHPDSFRIWSTINHVQAEAIKLGYVEGYNIDNNGEGYSKGYADGYEEGYYSDDKYQDGYDQGYADGYKDGNLDDQYLEGYDSGHEDGWNDGYDKAIKDSTK